MSNDTGTSNSDNESSNIEYQYSERDTNRVGSNNVNQLPHILQKPAAKKTVPVIPLLVPFTKIEARDKKAYPPLDYFITTLMNQSMDNFRNITLKQIVDICKVTDSKYKTDVTKYMNILNLKCSENTSFNTIIEQQLLGNLHKIFNCISNKTSSFNIISTDYNIFFDIIYNLLCKKTYYNNNNLTLNNEIFIKDYQNNIYEELNILIEIVSAHQINNAEELSTFIITIIEHLLKNIENSLTFYLCYYLNFLNSKIYENKNHKSHNNNFIIFDFSLTNSNTYINNLFSKNATFKKLKINNTEKKVSIYISYLYEIYIEYIDYIIEIIKSYKVSFNKFELDIKIETHKTHIAKLFETIIETLQRNITELYNELNKDIDEELKKHKYQYNKNKIINDLITYNNNKRFFDLYQYIPNGIFIIILCYIILDSTTFFLTRFKFKQETNIFDTFVNNLNSLKLNLTEIKKYTDNHSKYITELKNYRNPEDIYFKNPKYYNITTYLENIRNKLTSSGGKSLRKKRTTTFVSKNTKRQNRKTLQQKSRRNKIHKPQTRV